MRKLLMFAALILVANISQAAPLQLKNRIVFTRGALASPRDEMVWTMNLDGGDQKRVWRAPKGYGQFGGFSRDGKMALSFNGFNLYVHDLTKHKIEQVLVWNDGRGTYIDQPSFSPDGTQILCEAGGFPQNVQESFLLRLKVGEFHSIRGGLKDVMLIPKSEGSPPDYMWGNPRWTSDGKRIVATGGGQIWMIEADDLKATALTQNNELNEAPCSNPDQKQIVFVRGKLTESDIRMFVPSNIWILNRANGLLRQLTFNKEDPESSLKNIHVSSPIFTSYGTQIAFQHRGDIYRIDADGKNQKRLSDGQLIQWIP